MVYMGPPSSAMLEQAKVNLEAGLTLARLVAKAKQVKSTSSKPICIKKDIDDS